MKWMVILKKDLPGVASGTIADAVGKDGMADIACFYRKDDHPFTIHLDECLRYPEFFEIKCTVEGASTEDCRYYSARAIADRVSFALRLSSKQGDKICAIETRLDNVEQLLRSLRVVTETGGGHIHIEAD